MSKTTLMYCVICQDHTEHVILHERIGQCEKCKCINETPTIEGK